MNRRIVVVGSSNTDMIVQVKRLPEPGETVLGGDLVLAAGGKGANQAVAAARLGAEVHFIARVGTDLFAQQTLDALQGEGMNIDHITQDPDAPSGVALIVVGPQGKNIITVAPGANSRLSPEDVERASESFKDAAVVLLQLETPIETVQAAMHAAKRHGATVILNPAPAPAEPLPDSLLQMVDILTPNESEAARLAGETEPEKAVAALQRSGVRTIIVTLGEKGALVASKSEGTRIIPGFSVNAVDTTAAGDAFNGALAVALSRSKSLPEAVRYAHAVAALSVTQLGAQPSLPKASEVSEFLKTVGN